MLTLLKLIRMTFTYDSFIRLLHLLKKNGYTFSNYRNWIDNEKSVIMRHDIDNDIKKAFELAEIEKKNEVKSTYFILLTSDFYNVFSSNSTNLIKGIMCCGHDIGLHFDEMRYADLKTPADIAERITEEAKTLSLITEKKVDVVSMHRPSKMMLESDLYIPGIINTYGTVFFNQFKYLSDSRRCWREPVEEIVSSRRYDRLHILTHAIWYNDCDMNIHDSVFRFINSGNAQRYESLKSNISDLQSIMNESEIR